MSLIAMKAYSDEMPVFQFPKLPVLGDYYRQIIKIKAAAVGLIEEALEYYEKERDMHICIPVSNGKRCRFYNEEIEICKKALETGRFSIFWLGENGKEEIVY